MAIKAVVPNPARYRPAAAFATLAREHRAAVATLKIERVHQKVEKTCAEGHVAHGMRNRAKVLCASDAAAFDARCTGVPRFDSLAECARVPVAG